MDEVLVQENGNLEARAAIAGTEMNLSHDWSKSSVAQAIGW